MYKKAVENYAVFFKLDFFLVLYLFKFKSNKVFQ